MTSLLPTPYCCVELEPSTYISVLRVIGSPMLSSKSGICKMQRKKTLDIFFGNEHKS